MANITSSTFQIRPDGLFVDETHSIVTGEIRVYSYRNRVGIDPAAVMAARAAFVEVDVADQEFLRYVYAPPQAVTLQCQTAAQFATRFREAYRRSSGFDSARLAAWIIGMINGGFITDAQVRTAFGLTTTQYTTSKATLTAVSDAYNTTNTTAGQ